MEPITFVAVHCRSGTTALNVVTGALSSDARLADVPVVFAPTREGVVAAISRAAREGRRSVVGWSFYSPDFHAAAADLAWVRERTGGAPALHVAGGVHATAEPLQTLRAGFDRVAIGEGEATAVELVATLRDGGGIDRVRGLGRLDAAGALATGGPADRRALDEFPPFNARAGKYNAIEITRGCAFACSFCQTPFMFKARFRHRSVANVVGHVGAMRRDGLRFVRFLSPTSLSYGAGDRGVDLAAIEALLAAVREAIGPDGKIFFGTFPSEVRPEHVSREALAILRRYADNRTLVIGGQSGSERVLAATRRGHTVADVERAVAFAVEAGFVPDVDLLLGLPGESEEERIASLALAERLVARGARLHGHSFMPLPGTPLRGARPEPVEPRIALELSRLESRGALHGQWRRQAAIAEQLVALRSTRK